MAATTRRRPGAAPGPRAPLWNAGGNVASDGSASAPCTELIIDRAASAGAREEGGIMKKRIAALLAAAFAITARDRECDRDGRGDRRSGRQHHEPPVRPTRQYGAEPLHLMVEGLSYAREWVVADMKQGPGGGTGSGVLRVPTGP
ncbi:hypothetical protein ACFU3J_27885 [Streptomyces sp. NPDC057411]|uniref:hypothetical protein n=1 Tax=unclassified Streptomyces TaxID=2593676 RepID=UPI003639A70A